MRRFTSARTQASVLATLLAGGVLLAGCGTAGDDQAGDDTTSSASASASPTTSESASASPTTDSSTPSASASSSAAATLPDCASVWVDGQTLPLGYRGCVAGGRTVTAAKQSCEIGKPLVTYRNKFWAIADGPVHRVSGPIAKDPGWRHALVQCGG